jgi:hypothetical protein
MNAVRVHWARNILDSLVAEILVPEVEFGLDLVESLLGDANPAGFGDPLQAGRDVNPIAVDVLALDNDVA